jgi:hypothetical protein
MDAPLDRIGGPGGGRNVAQVRLDGGGDRRRYGLPERDGRKEREGSNESSPRNAPYAAIHAPAADQPAAAAGPTGRVWRRVSLPNLDMRLSRSSPRMRSDRLE